MAASRVRREVRRGGEAVEVWDLGFLRGRVGIEGCFFGLILRLRSDFLKKTKNYDTINYKLPPKTPTSPSVVFFFIFIEKNIK